MSYSNMLLTFGYDSVLYDFLRIFVLFREYCDPGYFGYYCIDICPYPYYGKYCDHTCNCSKPHCSHVIGCILGKYNRLAYFHIDTNICWRNNCNLVYQSLASNTSHVTLRIKRHKWYFIFHFYCLQQLILLFLMPQKLNVEIQS